ncbi:outer membrane beta-barrel protein [Mucilaginibacter lutimaris]|uniref:Outer membrane beta-barrel protein n=1 Tax=Mucilaginibacter lutimaris TaxID=931629 RepID=A0ABW2ZA47_9SPHI
MKEENQDSIDKLFSQGLSEPGDNAQYREEDWDAMEAMLDGKQRRGLVFNLLVLAGTIAAMFVLIIGWLYLNPAPKPDKNTQQAVKKEQPMQKDSGKYGPPVQQLADLKSNTLSANDSSAMSANELSRKSKSFFTLSAVPGGRNTTGNGFNQVAPHLISGTKQDAAVNHNALAGADSVTTYKNIPALVNNKAALDTLITGKAVVLAANNTLKDSAVAQKRPPLISVVDDIKPDKKQVRAGGGRSGPAAYAFRPTFSLSFIASPDINSTKGFADNKVGTNAGVLLTMGVSRKWSITTGAIYADKPYMTDFANYATAYKFTTNPVSVTASCTVLDIPINLGYQLYNNGRNKLSLGTGLSSYFMLREDYTYNYAGPYPGGPTSYNIRNQNKHILGVLNLNATYQREISSKFGVGVQPYFKVPLTGIGYGQVNLKSAGVAVGVTWHINTGIKP